MSVSAVAQEIKERKKKILNVLSNFGIHLDSETYCLLGKCKALANSQLHILDEDAEDYTLRIGISTNNGSDLYEKIYEALSSFRLCEKIDDDSLLFSYDDGKDSFTGEIHFGKSIKLLEWIYLYGYSSKYSAEHKLILLRVLADFYPSKITKWNNHELFIVDSYQSYDFFLHSGLVECVSNFEGRHGYSKVGQKNPSLSRIYSSLPEEIFQKLLDISSAKHVKTVETLLDEIKKSLNFKKKYGKIIKRANSLALKKGVSEFT
jgi:hypothetical protein